MPLRYWALDDIQQFKLLNGWQIETTSDVACHMWLRHTFTLPQKHPKAVYTRGLLTMYDARFCFVAFEDLEQNEPGDTIYHTFTWVPWEVCQTRYFYFWATSEGEPMISTSPLFSKHFPLYPPPTIYFSDPCPGITSNDGAVARLPIIESWGDIRNGAGTFAESCVTGLVIVINRTNMPPPVNFNKLYRAIMTWDLSLGIGFTISAAELHFYATYKSLSPGASPAINLFEATPASNNTLVAADYSAIGVIPLATEIPYSYFFPNVWHAFVLNAAGITLINNALAGDGIVKLGLRESVYDAPGVEPYPGESNRRIDFFVEDVDAPDPTHRPYLKVTWSE